MKSRGKAYKMGKRNRSETWRIAANVTAKQKEIIEAAKEKKKRLVESYLGAFNAMGCTQ